MKKEPCASTRQWAAVITQRSLRMEPPQNNWPLGCAIKATWMKDRAVSRYKKLSIPHTLFPSCISCNKVLHASFVTLLLPCSTCHGISPGITTSPPTMRLWPLGGPSVGSSASLFIHRGSFFRDWFRAGSYVAGGDAVVPAGVEGGDVVVVLPVSEVAFSRPCRDLVDTEPTAVRAVLPHGNSAGDARKQESHRGIRSHRHNI